MLIFWLPHHIRCDFCYYLLVFFFVCVYSLSPESTILLIIFQMCGPTGAGFLYGKINLLSSMPPFLGEV